MNQPKDLLPFALTVGEPAGVGPDVVLQLLTSLPAECRVTVFADRDMLGERARKLGLDFDLPDFDPNQHQVASLVHCKLEHKVVAGKPDLRNAKSVLESLRNAVAMVADGMLAGLVTAPVDKSVLASVEANFRGHTEYLGKLAGLKTDPIMAFVGPILRITLVTTHLPLCEVANKISIERILHVLAVADVGMSKILGGTKPFWQVCGLNPHAGEGGLLGHEELEYIAPAIEQAKRMGIDAIGPVPADTAFLPAKLDDRVCTLTMYHDQGLPVLKSSDFEATVNVTFGLPFVRTSVDHGTAVELAGTGRANAKPLSAALRLAQRIASQ